MSALAMMCKTKECPAKEKKRVDYLSCNRFNPGNSQSNLYEIIRTENSFLI
jgi:hypothetical protein